MSKNRMLREFSLFHLFCNLIFNHAKLTRFKKAS